MPRIARIVAPGLPHHLTARGNRRSDIFEDDIDRRVYRQQLHKYCAKAHVRAPAGVVDDWAQWLAFDNLEQEENLRAFTESGRPAGGAGFVAKLEKLLGRTLAARKRGRPRKRGN